MQDDNEKEDEDVELSNDEKAAIYIPMGVCFGVALGSVFQHIAIGITIGFLAGCLVSAYVTHSNKK